MATLRIRLPAGIGQRGLTLLRERIFTHFSVQFPLAQPAVSIAWDGLPFTPPANAAWVRIGVIAGQRLQQGAGRAGLSTDARPRMGLGRTARRERVGLVQVETFVPLGTDGNALVDATDISDDVEAVFDGALIDGLRIEAPSTQVLGAERTSPYHRHLTRIPVTQSEYPAA